MKDGGRLVGTIIAEDEGAITIRTASGVGLQLPRDVIVRGPATATDLRPASRLSDLNDTRLMFAPTGRPLGKGNGSFSNHYVVFPGFSYGVTETLGLSGGVSMIPGLGLDEQLFYVASTAGWELSEKAALAVVDSTPEGRARESAPPCCSVSRASGRPTAR